MATKRLIDANALESYLWELFRFFGSLPCSEADKTTQRAIKRCIGEVKKMPTVDAVEVVRCKDCIHFLPNKYTESGGYCNHFGYYDYAPRISENDYCSYGERKDNG